MTETNLRVLSDCQEELDYIDGWIRNHRFDKQTRFLISYSIIKACGTIEIVFKNMVFTYLSDNAKDDTKNYIEKMIVDASFNPSTNNMERLFEQLDSAKAIKLRSLYTSQEKGELNSLVSLRNDIAHGRTNNPSIGAVVAYYKTGISIINRIDSSLLA